MSSSVDAEYLLELNETISGGTPQDRNGIEGAAARPWTVSYGQEMFPTPWDKAGALFHAIASTQYFQDGNKRTAWIATEFLLLEMGIELKDLPDVNFEAFALTVAAVEDWDAVKAAEWYKANTKSVADKVDYAVLAAQGGLVDSAPGTWSGNYINFAGLTVTEMPVEVEVLCVFRVIWSSTDIGCEGNFSFRFESLENPDEPAGIHLVDEESVGYGDIIESGHSYHVDGAMPVIYTVGLKIGVQAAGLAMLVISASGEDIARMPLRITEHPQFPAAMGTEHLSDLLGI